MDSAPSRSPRRAQSQAEEWANSLSHGLGALSSLAALPFLLSLTVGRGAPLVTLGAAVFSLSALFLYASSSVYHALPVGRAKRVLRHVDHAGIFVLVAGSYTPFMLGPLRGPWGWSLLFVVWLVAAAGIVWKAHPRLRRDRAPVWLYLVMGWLVVVAVRPMWDRMSLQAIVWVAAGGAFYTLGVLFYALDRRRFFHFVWHLFVLAGTASHFVALRLTLSG